MSITSVGIRDSELRASIIKTLDCVRTSMADRKHSTREEADGELLLLRTLNDALNEVFISL